MSEMQLNKLQPGEGSKKKRLRVGRGASAGQGKTCGRGVKGQRARKGGYHKVGFEGGQMPLQRRLPKVGFRSKMAPTRSEITLTTLQQIASKNNGVVDLEVLIAASCVPAMTTKVKVILSGEITVPVTVRGLALTVGALKALESAGGKAEAPPAVAPKGKLKAKPKAEAK